MNLINQRQFIPAFLAVYGASLSMVWAISLLFFLPAAIASDEQAGNDNENTVLAGWAMPEIQLAPLEMCVGQQDCGAFLQQNTLRIAALAESEINKAKQAAQWLAASNHVLSYELEQPFTQLLYGQLSNENRATALESISRSLQYLDMAKTSLRDVPADTDELDQKVEQLSKARDTLNAFSIAARSLFLEVTNDEAAAERRMAIAHMAIFLESEEPQLVAAATLWDQLLRSSVEGAARSRESSHLLAKRIPGHSPYDLFSRMAFIHEMIREKKFPLAVSLLQQMEVRSDIWLTGKESDQWLASVDYLMLGALKAWGLHLKERDNDAYQWTVLRFQQLKSTLEQTDDEEPNVDGLLRIGMAIPLIINQPE